MPPATVVFGRTLLGAAFLVPLAASRRTFRGVRPVIVPIFVVTVLDMAAPTFLTAWGEQHVSSSVAGILTATDPLFTAVLALWLIRSEAPDRRRTAGLITGFVGVVALLGIDLHGSAIELLGAGAVILSALGYASAALLYRRWLADQEALAITALMTAISGVAFLPPAAIDLPRHIPPASSILALATLGIVNTGIAYWLFYLLIDEAGAATASVITYVMPVVALFLGVGLLGERLTIGAIAGLILIAVGAGRACGCLPGGHGEVLRGSRGDAAGIELGSSFVERIAVNTGTVPVCPASRGQRAGLGWARCRPIGRGRGGAAVVLRAGESPRTWGRAAAVSRREGGCNAARRAAEWQRPRSGPGGAVVAGSGDAGQASPLGGG